jgi:hypothetical protein
MAKSSKPSNSPDNHIRVTFVGLGEGEAAPEVALYSLDDEGKPTAKLATAKQGLFPLGASRLKGRIAIGPDVPNLAELSADRLLTYRADQVAKVWAGTEGIVLSPDRWGILWPPYYCVSGQVRKCRPWWWDIVTVVRPPVSIGVKTSRALALKSQLASRVSLASGLAGIRYFPWRCVPLCDGIVEVYQRLCCCNRIIIDDLIDRLREVLERIPIPWPPEPDPGPYGPQPDPWKTAIPYAGRPIQSRMAAKAAAGTIAQDYDHTAAPPQRLYEAYQDLTRLPRLEAERYALERPWLFPYFCTCSSRKVGEVAIQPNGEFDFCYRRFLAPFRCYYTYAYKVRQFIGGMWVTVYDGVAAGAWFADGEEADIRVTNPKALPCGDPNADPPPNDGTPFVMLEYVTWYETHHFNFPVQTGVSQVGPVTGNRGLITFGGTPDCPWGATLELRLWASGSLKGTVAYYRMSVMPVNAAGSPVGAPVPLADPVSWKRFDANADVVADSLGPQTVNGVPNLFRMPYWSQADAWLSAQPHQRWNTSLFANGKYMLIIELFDSAGAQIKPNGAAGPGTGKAFQFRRWTSDSTTADVPFSDCAHVFWIDNLAVSGDIVDLRKNGIANAAECQFTSGVADDQFSIGYRAYHVNGVSNSDSFMQSHSIWWQRGLNGPWGWLAPAGNSPTTDAGEGGPPAQSGGAGFGAMLGPNLKCTFSVHLSVYAKHTNGASRLSGYDYYETASFALDVGP